MAHTEKPMQRGHGKHEDTNEYYDSSAMLRQNVALLAQTIVAADGAAVAYTGAGVSTSADIPDYRGPNGVWTRLEAGLSAPQRTSLARCRPTFAHRVLAAMAARGMLRGVVSTNIDGLHMRSGIPLDQLAELHGNCFVEYCPKCKTRYSREFDVTEKGCRKDHQTGRHCDSCTETPLLDNIVHFGEQLPIDQFNLAQSMGKGSKVALVLGTSLRVRPASDLPLSSDDIFIVNLQKTPHDVVSRRVIRGRTDLVMYLLAKELKLEIPGGQYNPGAGWEATYDARAAECEGKRKEASKLALSAVMSDVASRMKPSTKGEIRDQHNADTDVIDQSGPLLIRNCTNSTIRIKCKLVKLVVLDCTRVKILLESKILTGVFEIINCDKCFISIQTRVPTIQVDNSPKTRIGFGEASFCGKIIASANCHPLFVAPSQISDSQELVFPGLKTIIKDEFLRQMTQYCTRIDKDTNNVLSEVVVREGNGYATTQREKDAADEKDERNMQFLEKFLGSVLKLSSGK